MAIFLCMIMFVGGHILAAAETTVPDDGSLACYTNTFMPAVVLPSSKEYVNVSPPVVSTIYPPYHASGLYAADASAGATVCIRYQVLMNSTGWTEADAGTWPLVTDGPTPSSGWIYGAVADASCQQLAETANTSDTYSEVLCCDNHECNTPDPALDAANAVGAGPSITSQDASLTCYTRVPPPGPPFVGQLPVNTYPAVYPYVLDGSSVTCLRAPVVCQHHPLSSNTTSAGSSSAMTVTAPLCNAGSQTLLYTALTHAPCSGAAAPNGQMLPDATCCYEQSCNAPLQKGGNSTAQGYGLSEAPAEQTLTCWESIPAASAPGSTHYVHPPYLAAVAPVTYPLKDSWGGQSVCLRYQKECTEGNDFCSSEEQVAGAVKWLYFRRTQQDCAAMQASGGAYLNLECCSSSGCNVPDASLDSTTEVVAMAAPPEYTSLSCYQSAGEVVSGAPRMAYLDVAGTSAGAAAYRTQPTVCASVTYNACGALPDSSQYLPGVTGKNCSEAEAAEGVWWTAYFVTDVSHCYAQQLAAAPAAAAAAAGNASGSQQQQQQEAWRCCATHNCNSPQLVGDSQVLVVEGAAAASLSCYSSASIGTDPDQGATPHGLAPMVYPVSYPASFPGQGPWVCSSYKEDVCATGARNCTPQESGAGIWRYVYHHAPMAACTAMQWMQAQGEDGSPQQVTCCLTDNCNAPPAEDTTTELLPVPSAPTISCYSNVVGAGIMGAAGAKPDTFTTGSTAYLTVFNTTEQPAPDVYDPAAAHPGFGGPPLVCAKYRHDECGTAARNCTPDEQSAGVWRWQYLPLAAPACRQLQWLSLQGEGSHADVTCCVSDACNAPDPAEDADTQAVTGPPPWIGDQGGQGSAPPNRADVSGPTLTCWESIPAASAPGSTHYVHPPYLAAVAPVTYPLKDSWGGQSVCLRYQKECTEGNDFCSSEEQVAGAVKWLYFRRTQQDCAAMQASGGAYLNLECCSSSGCNVPDASLDSTTEVVAMAAPPEYTSLSCYQSAGEVVPGAPRMAYLDVAGTSAGAAAYRTQPTVCASVTYNACGALPGSSQYLPGVTGKNCSEAEAAEGVWWTAYFATDVSHCYAQQLAAAPAAAAGNASGSQQQQEAWRCCATHNCNSPQLAGDNLTVVADTPASDTLSCYIGSLGSETALIAAGAGPEMPPAAYPVRLGAIDENTKVPLVCSKFQVPECGNFLECTEEQAAVGMWLWSYSPMPVHYCKDMQLDEARAPQGAGFRRVTCCVTDNCNAPLPDDNSTRVLDVPSTPTISCYNNVPGAAGGFSANTASALDTGADPTFDPTVGNTAYLEEFNTTVPTHARDHPQGPLVCAKYRYNLCGEGDECPPEARANGDWRWQYVPMPALACALLQWASGHTPGAGQNVTCCTTDGCNAPDQLEYPHTYIGTANTTGSSAGDAGHMPAAELCTAANSFTALGAFNVSVSVWSATAELSQPPGAASNTMPLSYLRVTAYASPSWMQEQQALRQSGKQHFVAWKHALVPVLPAPESYQSAVSPPPSSVVVHKSGSCEVSRVVLQLCGADATFHMRIVPVPGGSYLEVLGQFSSTPPALQALLPPHGVQMRTVVKLETQVQGLRL
ncbi:hypothetical protein COO60DRAFT_354766 [Scenedesmus sp. NREL 46B-D3]|nr:hypothetical protein COO60DRAFT_354766 [Scenedesmus sp. NREL 46B-D3]